VAFNAGQRRPHAVGVETLNRARSASVTTTDRWLDVDPVQPPLPVSAPAARNSNAVDSTVRAANPEISHDDEQRHAEHQG